MEKHTKSDTKTVLMLKALLAAYMLTGLLLLVLAGLLYKMNLDEQKTAFGIIAIYVLATFAGGMIAGKLAGQRKFLWGSLLGVCYFLLLGLISFGVFRSFQGSAADIVTAFLLCAGGGMAGGMVS